MTTIGTAAVIGFAGLSGATTAYATSVPAPSSVGTLSGVHGHLAQGPIDEMDRLRECLYRSKSVGHTGDPMPWIGHKKCHLG